MRINSCHGTRDEIQKPKQHRGRRTKTSPIAFVTNASQVEKECALADTISWINSNQKYTGLKSREMYLWRGFGRTNAITDTGNTMDERTIFTRTLRRTRCFEPFPPFMRPIE